MIKTKSASICVNQRLNVSFSCMFFLVFYNGRQCLPYMAYKGMICRRCGNPLSPAGGGLRGWTGTSKNVGTFTTWLSMNICLDDSKLCNDEYTNRRVQEEKW